MLYALLNGRLMGASSPIVATRTFLQRRVERKREGERTGECFPELASNEVGDELAFDADDLLLPRLQHRKCSLGKDVEVGINKVGVNREAVVPAHSHAPKCVLVVKRATVATHTN
jgi:hypothetical protein